MGAPCFDDRTVLATNTRAVVNGTNFASYDGMLVMIVKYNADKRTYSVRPLGRDAHKGQLSKRFVFSRENIFVVPQTAFWFKTYVNDEEVRVPAMCTAAYDETESLVIRIRLNDLTGLDDTASVAQHLIGPCVCDWDNDAHVHEVLASTQSQAVTAKVDANSLGISLAYDEVLFAVEPFSYIYNALVDFELLENTYVTEQSEWEGELGVFRIKFQVGNERPGSNIKTFQLARNGGVSRGPSSPQGSVRSRRPSLAPAPAASATSHTSNKAEPQWESFDFSSSAQASPPKATVANNGFTGLLKPPPRQQEQTRIRSPKKKPMDRSVTCSDVTPSRQQSFTAFSRRPSAISTSGPPPSFSQSLSQSLHGGRSSLSGSESLSQSLHGGNTRSRMRLPSLVPHPPTPLTPTSRRPSISSSVSMLSLSARSAQSKRTIVTPSARRLTLSVHVGRRSRLDAAAGDGSSVRGGGGGRILSLPSMPLFSSAYESPKKQGTAGFDAAGESAKKKRTKSRIVHPEPESSSPRRSKSGDEAPKSPRRSKSHDESAKTLDTTSPRSPRRSKKESLSLSRRNDSEFSPSKKKRSSERSSGKGSSEHRSPSKHSGERSGDRSSPRKSKTAESKQEETSKRRSGSVRPTGSDHSPQQRSRSTKQTSESERKSRHRSRSRNPTSELDKSCQPQRSSSSRNLTADSDKSPRRRSGSTRRTSGSHSVQPASDSDKKSRRRSRSRSTSKNPSAESTSSRRASRSNVPPTEKSRADIHRRTRSKSRSGRGDASSKRSRSSSTSSARRSGKSHSQSDTTVSRTREQSSSSASQRRASLGAMLPKSPTRERRSVATPKVDAPPKSPTRERRSVPAPKVVSPPKSPTRVLRSVPTPKIEGPVAVVQGRAKEAEEPTAVNKVVLRSLIEGSKPTTKAKDWVENNSCLGSFADSADSRADSRTGLLCEAEHVYETVEEMTNGSKLTPVIRREVLRSLTLANDQAAKAKEWLSGNRRTIV